MAIINRALLNARFTDYKREFNSAYGALTKDSQDWRICSSYVESSTDLNDYAALLDNPAVRQWIGPRTAQNLTARTYQLRNLDWEATFLCNRNDFLDDKESMIRARTSKLAAQFARKVRFDIFDAYRTGSAAASLCWDGRPFFDALHPCAGVAGGVIANENTAGAHPNPWILLDSKIAMGGVLFQERQRPRMATFGEGSEWAETNNTYLFMGHSRYVIGYGLWQSAYQSNQVFSEAAFWGAYQAMLQFRDENGYEMDIDPDTLIYHPNDTAIVRNVLKNTGLYAVGAVGVDSAARGVIKNLVPCAYI